MTRATAFLNRRLVPALTALSENTELSAIRAGMVSVVPLTIIGGLFMIVAFLPVPGWEARIADYLDLLQVPVSATFGLLAVFACFAVAYDLGKRLKQEAMVSALMATLVFLMIQLDLEEHSLVMEGLGSKGLFTAILVALVTVRVQQFLTERQLVIKLPASVPSVVYESFLSLTPMILLLVLFWVIRFVLDIDINQRLQTTFQPLVFALNTLPGILVYAFLVTMLWSVGINGDNTMDAIVAPIFLQYLADNVTAVTQGQPLPYVTAYGFFTAFVNVGGTGATLALALLMLNSKDPVFRKVSRLSLPTQVFQINEPIFFGFPIVLNPVFMIPYVFNALLLTTSTYLLMQWGLIHKPFVNVPWTTPPILGHYLVTGGDWRAAVWGAASIGMAMLVYLPFARAGERQRLKACLAGPNVPGGPGTVTPEDAQREGSAMLQTCPHCSRRVLFATDQCPSCLQVSTPRERLPAQAPLPPRAGGWIRLSQVLFSFEGRIGRAKWWAVSVPTAVIVWTTHFLLLKAFMAGRLDETDYFLASAVEIIVAAWILLAAQIKRLHDVGLSGWISLIGLLSLIPTLGILLSLLGIAALGTIEGSHGPNKYGKDPLSPEPVAEPPTPEGR